MRMAFKYYVLAVLLQIQLVFSINKDELFPFGSVRDQSLNSDLDDTSSFEVQLTVPIVFYEESYRTVFVNDNGLLSFLTEVPSFFNAQFPLSYPIIAPLYSDVDTRGTGKVYFRETQASDLIDRATKEVRRHFSTAAGFQATSLFIVTWDNVGHYERKTNLANTFQVVVASNGEDSYVYLLYPEGGIQWIQGDGKNANLPDARAQSGFMSGDGRLFTLRGSGTDQTKNLDRMSNIHQPGVWMFHVGKTGSTGNVLPADTSDPIDQEFEQDLQSCTNTQVPCPPTAQCVDYEQGFCCNCSEGYFGNGRSCIEKTKPHRMNGKVGGIINEVRLENMDLHAYIVTEDGRTYTAISRVPSTVGYDMQALFTLGGVIGWLFAKPQTKMLNGFMITGGAFNRTAEIEFTQSGHTVLIKEDFLGPDVFNYMRVNIQMRGTLPPIPFASKIEVEDFEEEFTKVSPGQIRSHSTKAYRLAGNSLEIPFTVDQTITFNECEFAPVDPNVQNFRLKLARNFIIYDSAEEIVRFASTNTISPLSSDDPCKEGRSKCGQNSKCIVEGGAFRCICDRGYESVYEDENSGDRATCIDINECLVGKDNCHINAECVNLQGSFGCRCLPGYFGDGIHCQRIRTCSELNCDINAVCHQVPDQNPSCRCQPGYQGDGYVCRSVQENAREDCRQVDFCDPQADCVYASLIHAYHCVCRSGYQGDGTICLEVESCDIEDNCHLDAECVYDDVTGTSRCVCNIGFTGDGYNCQAERNERSCDVVNNCHPWAQCIYNSGQHQCQCNAGYVGNGYQCSRNEDVSCNQVNICSVFANCDYDYEHQKYTCRCNEGYDGDGVTCNPLDECNTVENCDPNAQCIYDSTGQRYRCQCNSGFAGNGKQCEAERGVSCHIVNVCHAQARCMYDSVDLRYRCQCQPGYEGDGLTCQESIVSCNVINNCHPSADCRYDASSQGYRCQCKSGYEGDGYNCRLVRSCLDDLYLCDVNAECLLLPGTNQHVCQCKSGFAGDGTHCSEAPQHSGDFLLFSQGMSLLRMPFNPTKRNRGKLLLMEPGQTAVGLDVDCVEGYIYWTDHGIRRARYNGSNFEVLFDYNVFSPEGIAVDWVSRNIYWTDSLKDTIEVLRPETLDHKILVNDGLVNPRGITLHPGLGKLYWSDWNREQPKIEVSNMDGSERSIFVRENLGLPNMLTIDYEHNDLCWTDSGLRRLECIGLTGQHRRVIFTPAEYPFGIAITGGHIYWTDWKIQFIQKINRNGGTAEPLELPLGGNGKLYSIAAVPSQCPRVRNACGSQNGGCQHLCLPNGRGGRTCVCPQDSTCNEV